MIKIEQIVVYRLVLALKQPFETSFGCITERESLLIEIKSQGLSAWGEAATLPFPFYNHEDIDSALHILEKYLCPWIINQQPQDLESVNQILHRVIGNNIAKAGIETACADLFAKVQNKPLFRFLGGERSELQVGAVVSEFEDIALTLNQVSIYLEQGYARVKLKISPGKDLSLLQAVRKNFPSAQFMVDANAAYSLEDLALFKKFDELDLLMIEQPFNQSDLVDHAVLQSQIKTIVCLDESIESRHDAVAALRLGSCRAINIKPARVGGLQEAKAIHDLAMQHGVGVWCGGMLESGIGRAHNMASASLRNYIYAGDIAESKRYFEEDIIEPLVSFVRPGILLLPEKPGIGFEVLSGQIEKNSSYKIAF